jgi:2-methylcitrate dehydratase PrpD
VKRFPNCGSAHRAMDGILDLKDRGAFTVKEIESINVRAPVTHLNNLMYTNPETGLEAKFSLEYGVAIALLAGNAALADFTDEAARRPEIRALYPLIHRYPVDKAEGEFPTEVEVVLKDGRRFETKVPMPVGSLAAPFSLDQYWTKLEGCAAGLLGDEALGDLRRNLADLPNLPNVQPLMARLAGPFAS